MTSPSDLPVILLDMDGVLVDCGRQNIERVNAKFGTDFQPEDITSFEYDFLTDDQRRFIFDECWHDPTLYDECDLDEERLETIALLGEVARVVVCSSPLQGHIASKYRFLTRYFDRSDIVLTSDKALVGGDILIDDAPHNIEAFPGHTIIYDQPYNRDLPGPRASTFSDIGPLVLGWLFDHGYDIL